MLPFGRYIFTGGNCTTFIRVIQAFVHVRNKPMCTCPEQADAHCSEKDLYDKIKDNDNAVPDSLCAVLSAPLPVRAD